MSFILSETFICSCGIIIRITHMGTIRISCKSVHTSGPDGPGSP